MSGAIVLVCQGGCGKTSDDVSPFELWRGEVKQSSDPECLVEWTCRECMLRITEAKLKRLKQEQITVGDLKVFGNTDNVPYGDVPWHTSQI